jgi:cation diffusion facilitator family transporter
MPEGSAPATRDRETSEIRMLALAAFLLNLVLAVGKALVLRSSNSLALSASVVDSASDSLASLAVFAGVILSTRKTRQFPLGLYKIENIISVVVALFIFIAGYEIARGAFASEVVDAPRSPLAVGVMVANTILIFVFGRYALRRGQATGSPALIAEGRHRQSDVLSSLAVLAALLADFFGLDFNLRGITPDRIAALVVLVFVARSGWHLLADGMRVLLDAALPPAELQYIRTVIESDPAVVNVRSLFGRNAGRFVFVQATVGIRGEGLERAHAISHRIEEAVRSNVPHVERVVIHYEPARGETVSVALPVDGESFSGHFGEAPAFRITEVRRADREVVGSRTLDNPHLAAKRGKGALVARWLAEQGIDVLIIPDTLGSGMALAALENAGILIHPAQATSPDEALARYIAEIA